MIKLRRLVYENAKNRIDQQDNNNISQEEKAVQMEEIISETLNAEENLQCEKDKIKLNFDTNRMVTYCSKKKSAAYSDQ